MYKAEGIIRKVAGPLVVAEHMESANMYDVVRVSGKRLIGEIVELRGDRAGIQVYEETSGLAPGAPVESTGMPLSVELGPGLLNNIFDGIQRPLDAIKAVSGSRLGRGEEAPSLDRHRKWLFVPSVEAGAAVSGGDIIGYVQETGVPHKIMIPPQVKGVIESINEGEYTVDQAVAVVTGEQGGVDIPLMQQWPVRIGRPYKTKLRPETPLITGQRVIDALFPLAMGGTAAIPGPFGSGKTVLQHQLAKWADVDIVVYIGCGERGNEMTGVLQEFHELKDPRTGKSLMERTVLIANTSDMPVAAREASVYTGVTIAEYFRDMGYSVALMADSTSRWAEAMREMSGRLEEMPGEEGYPAYLGSRLAQFYERAGRVIALGSGNREGSLTIIGSVSPSGGDLSEPVTQATLRIVKVFWGLDSQLAYARHFPAINWLTSYSLYSDDMGSRFNSQARPDWVNMRARIMLLLQEENELEDIIRLIGINSLSPLERLKLEAARCIREDFLNQDAFHETDAYSSLDKQYVMMGLMLKYYDLASEALNKGAAAPDLVNMETREAISRIKYVEAAEVPDAADIINRLDREIGRIIIRQEAR